MTNKTVALAVALGTILIGGVAARAADISIASRKLTILDKVVATGKAKATFAAKDPGITKGTGTSTADISAQLDVHWDAMTANFLMPAGASDGTRHLRSVTASATIWARRGRSGRQVRQSAGSKPPSLDPHGLECA